MSRGPLLYFIQKGPNQSFQCLSPGRTDGLSISLLSPFQNLHPDTQAYFLKFDSVHGKIKGSVSSKENTLIVEEKQIHVSNETDLSKIKWKDFNVDFVIEATGIFTSKKDAKLI